MHPSELSSACVKSTRRKQARLLLSFCWLVSLPGVAGCALQRFEAPKSSAGFRLASASEPCVEARRHRRYYLLFGVLPLNSSDPAAFTGTAPRRFEERVTGSDLAITILGGWAISLVRRTTIMLKCPQLEPAPVASQDAAQDRALMELLRGREVVLLGQKGERFPGNHRVGLTLRNRTEVFRYSATGKARRCGYAQGRPSDGGQCSVAGILDPERKPDS